MSDEHTDERQAPALYRPSQELAVPSDYTYYPAASVEPTATDYERLARLLWARKWLIVLALIVGTAAGFGAARYGMERVYEASTTIWVEVERQGSGRRGPIRAEEVFQGEGWTDVLASYAVLEPVAIDAGLYLTSLDPKEPATLFESFELLDDVDPGTYHLVRDGNADWELLLGGVEPVDSGSAGDPIGLPAGFSWKPSPDALAPYASQEIRFRVTTPRRAAGQLRRKLEVFWDRESAIITAQLSGEDPREVAELLNHTADRFIETATDLRSQNLREVVTFLEEQAAEAAAALMAAEYALEKFRIEAITLPTEAQTAPLPGVPSMRDPVVGAYFAKRVEADQLGADVRALQRVLGKLQTEGELDLVGLQLIQPTGASMALQTAIAEYNEKELQRRTLLYAYTEAHPQVRQVTEEIESIERAVIPSLVSDVIVELGARHALIEEEIAAQATELKRIPTRTIDEARLRREFANAEGLHQNLSSRLKEAQLAEATKSLPALRVLDRAAAPYRPLQNNAIQLILFGSIAGLGLGIGGILLVDRLDKRIRYPEQVTGTLGLPVLGAVPFLNRKDLSDAARAAIGIEAFRTLRTQLSHVGQRTGITMITSPEPQDGKSTVTANLAIAYASAGYRTALVDGDTRRGRSEEMFNLESSPGLTDYLLGRAALDEVLQPTGVDGLDLLVRGNSGGFDRELLGGSLMRDLLSHLKTEYEVVLIDAAPLAAGADALLLGELADKVIVVLRAGSTDRKMARAKLDMIGNVDLPIVGAVLNAVPQSAHYYPYYVSYYYADKEAASTQLVS